MKKARIICAALLIASLFCTADLGINLLYNTAPELHDGFTSRSILHGVFSIFGDSRWTFDRFFAAFEASAWTTFVLTFVNAAVHLCKPKENSLSDEAIHKC